MPFDPEKVIKALWCVDSETGEELLVNLATNEVLLRRTKEHEIIKPAEEAPKC